LTHSSWYLKPAKLKNAQVDFSVLSHVEKAVFQCIGTYVYLSKRPRTHRDRLTPLLLVPPTYNVQKFENALVIFNVLLRVKKAVFRCISTYAYLPKRPRTH